VALVESISGLGGFAMRVAITGGTGFVGRHLARALVAGGHEAVLIARGKDVRDESIYKLVGASFFSSDLSNSEELRRAFSGCKAVGHCAGINREIGAQTYQRVHIEGTKNVVEAAQQAGVPKIVLLSFLRARPNCRSAYHESKWAAEQIVRGSVLDYTIFKAGVIYGRGDHMLDHLSHALYTFPIFGLVGMKEKPIRPLAVEDLVATIVASFHDARLSNKTVSITGPEEIALSEAVCRVGEVIGRHPQYVPMPLAIQKIIACVAEGTMKIPLLSLAQLRILSEGIVEALPACDRLPVDLLPTTRFTAVQIQKGLPEPGPFGLRDLRCAGMEC
jgi:nucleoside-diphosphate-sugar epimerase